MRILRIALLCGVCCGSYAAVTPVPSVGESEMVRVAYRINFISEVLAPACNVAFTPGTDKFFQCVEQLYCIEYPWASDCQRGRDE